MPHVDRRLSLVAAKAASPDELRQRLADITERMLEILDELQSIRAALDCPRGWMHAPAEIRAAVTAVLDLVPLLVAVLLA